MRSRRLSIPLALALVACASQPEPRVEIDGAIDGQVEIEVVFEPALAEPGVLTVEHEAGIRLELPTGRTGVELRLPPGPASLRLRAGDRIVELPIRIHSAETIVLATAPPHAVPSR